jgi:GAF domain-containing protein
VIAIGEDTLLDVLEQALPQLRRGLHIESATATAELLHCNLQLDAAAVSSRDRVLAFVGAGSDHHLPGAPNLTRATREALETGRVVSARTAEEIGCSRAGCPLTSGLIVPLFVRGDVAGALKLYHTDRREIDALERRVATGLARLFSIYLEVAELDARVALVTRTELEACAALRKLPVEHDGRTLLVRASEIRYAEARGRSVEITTRDVSYRFAGSLSECWERLRPHGFVRVHRAYIVNPEHVVEINPFFRGTYVLRVDDCRRSEIPVSRSASAHVRRLFAV